ncbi:MAG: bifunctional oligoribonuclease/PAP phosphatase NrnA [Armatimonadetes bacterium]|nr:bifunctional oligoribonuclease/PAP phosphatase NrnA [Armatimonadota bacterium]
MMNQENLKQAWQRLLEYGSFVLACHVRPDGDTLGSALAVAHVLRKLGKDVVVICEDIVPDNYMFMPDAETILTSTDRRDFEVGMLVDSEATKRVGSAAAALESAAVNVCIDHHVPNGEYGDIRAVDPGASATAVVIYELFEANNVEIDQEAATQLMAALVADTGGFRFGNTNTRAFEIAAKLTALGADPSTIYRSIFESKPIKAALLLGRALNSLEMDDHERVIWSGITQRDLTELGSTDADTDSIVNQIGAVKGPQVAILFRETRPGSIRISLRSRGGYDVDRVARVFGGGGHKAAAGCTVHASLEEAEKMVVAEVLKWMES